MKRLSSRLALRLDGEDSTQDDEAAREGHQGQKRSAAEE